MLGRRVSDPQGIEGPPAQAEGLALLDLETELGGEKTLIETQGRDIASGESVRGYEIHIGTTRGKALDLPMLDLDGRPDGAVSADGRVAGCYLHGLFAADGYRHSLLSRLGARNDPGVAYEQQVEEALDAVADHLQRHLNLERILKIAENRL